MKTLFRNSVLWFTILILLQGCESTAHLYRSDNRKKVYFGYINDGTYSQIKQFLSTATSKLNDTIFIKYEYNNETCWNYNDQHRSDDEIRLGISRWQAFLQETQNNRKSISIFRYREPGNNLNKIVKFDSSIQIDNKKFLYNLLFKTRTTCGSSIMIMPDKRFLFIRSDSHFEALFKTKQEIEDILNKK